MAVLDRAIAGKTLEERSYIATVGKSVAIYPISQAALSLELKSILMNTLDKVLETVLQLPYEQQEMLIKILQKRHYSVVAAT